MSNYRIVEHPIGFEPQMRYTMGALDGERWFPLDATGHWLEPEAFSYGKISRRLLFIDRNDAERVVLRATAINGEYTGNSHERSEDEPDAGTTKG